MAVGVLTSPGIAPFTQSLQPSNRRVHTNWGMRAAEFGAEGAHPSLVRFGGGAAAAAASCVSPPPGMLHSISAVKRESAYNRACYCGGTRGCSSPRSHSRDDDLELKGAHPSLVRFGGGAATAAACCVRPPPGIGRQP